MTSVRLSVDQLRRRVDPAALGFRDTSELLEQALPWIGQARAETAARFGLRLDQPGYNLFVLGEVGSGRTTLLRQMMQAEAVLRPVPPDLCYLHNFETPEHPRALRLPAGDGRLFRQSMAQWVKRLGTDIPKRLLEPDCKTESERIEKAYKTEEDMAYAAISAYAESRHFSLMREQGHMVFSYRDEKGEPMTAGRAMTLPHEQRAEIDSAEADLRDEIGRFLEKTRSMEHVMNEGLAALRRQVIKPLIDHELQAIRNTLRKPIQESDKLTAYLERVQQEVLENLELFQPGDEEEARLEALESVLSRLGVNVVVDNHGLVGAPVIQEDNPLFRQLFGSIEYDSGGDMLVTDFSRIRAGSLLKAHGGFLMLHLRDLLADAPVWEKLYRFLRSGRLQIEEPGAMYSPIAAVSLEPDPVDVQVKIVLIASVDEFYAVQEADPEFARRFRCKVDFVDSFVATPESLQATAVFVSHTCREKGLPHFDAQAVAVLIEDTHRQAGDQSRQSAIFARSQALVIEGAALAQQRGATLVQAQDVQAALLSHRHRHDHAEQRLQEAIAEGDRLLDVAGQCTGQINGLTVVDLGDHSFGLPVRVTARTHAGEEGLLNMEREVEMSGPIHDKGVLILHSYLSSLFAHMAPLAMNAAVVFEQEYSGVEGDSASCAELYALLSSLANVPLAQAIAVTGALNQRGEVLPVGGINEKIEGYFRSCELLGLNGQQGVLMPTRNLRHLMLSSSVVQAVAQGRFHVHAVASVADGMTLLCGLPFGELGVDGYAPNTLLGRVQATLKAYRAACEAIDGRHARRHLTKARPARPERGVSSTLQAGRRP